MTPLKPSRIELEPQSDRLIVRIHGVVNEDTELKKLFAQIQSIQPQPKILSFDLSPVTSINSVGTREWLILIRHAQSVYACEMLSVSEPFADQCNIIADLLGKKGTVIHTVAVPYFCATCKRRTVEATPASQIRPRSQGLSYPKRECAQCKSALELDTDEGYFDFLSQT